MFLKIARKIFCLIVFIFPSAILAIQPDSVICKETEQHKLNPSVLKLALTAYNCALKQGVKIDHPIITIIDYSLPSTAKRLWVVDLKSKKVLFNTLVAHGKNSGVLFAKYFSNTPESDASSLGLFVTAGTYMGHDGYSLILDGLEKGYNDKAKQRHIIIHGAWYVTRERIRQLGRLGRSWGCPAIDLQWVHQIIDAIKGQTPVFIYYPHRKWLRESKFLNC